MISKKVADIGLADIEELIASQVREGKTIEYKRHLYTHADANKKEFLADVSSFANTGGGDLLFGVDAADGVPTALTPLHIENIDAEVLQIEGIVRSGVDPRFAFTVHPIEVKPGEYVLLLRIYESWNKPHRVVFGGSAKFYARSSAGKYELDVEELRQIFTLSDGIEKRMAEFRAERLITIQTGATMLPLTSENLVVVHLLPLSSFSTKTTLSRDTLLALEKESALFEPMFQSGWHAPRINLEGVFSYDGTAGEHAHTYVQLFRNGAIELVESAILDRADGIHIPHKALEVQIVNGVKRAVEILKKVEVGAPVAVSVSLLNVRGMKMSGETRRFSDHEHPIQQKDLILPPVLLNDYEQNVGKTLQSTFDLVWNACGLPKSANYDDEGNFLIVR